MKIKLLVATAKLLTLGLGFKYGIGGGLRDLFDG